MTIVKSTAIMTVALGAIALVSPAFGCDCNCDPPDVIESGDYVILAPAYDPIHPGDEWLVGGNLHIDRDARFATIRYTRDGTTYEVRFTLDK